MKSHSDIALASAIDLVDRFDLPAVSCRSDKGPATPNGCKNAARDRDELIDLWRRHPGALVGVPTGATSGFDVLDVDPRDGGDAWLAANLHRLPATRTHHTRSGGQHLLFVREPGLGNSAGKIAAGVDVRGDGGDIIWWPSSGLCVDNADEVADWPTWLLDALTAPARAAWTPTIVDGGKRDDDDGCLRYVTEAQRHACVRVATAPLGARNHTLNTEAFAIGRVVAAGTLAARDVASQLAAAAYDAGLDEREIARTLTSALKARVVS